MPNTFTLLTVTIITAKHMRIIKQWMRQQKTEHLSCISIGWDPGTFSVQRVLGNAFIPGAKTYGFLWHK